MAKPWLWNKNEIEHSHAEKVAPCQCLFEQEPWALYNC